MGYCSDGFVRCWAPFQKIQYPSIKRLKNSLSVSKPLQKFGIHVLFIIQDVIVVKNYADSFILLQHALDIQVPAGNTALPGQRMPLDCFIALCSLKTLAYIRAIQPP